MIKGGIPYFPLECELDSKFELIEAEYGLDGFGVVVKLFQKIYGGQGYYFEWTDEVALVFARRIGLGASAVSEIVSAAIRRGVFDRELFEKYKILTSKGIQKRYFEAVSRRRKVEVKKAYLLVEVGQICKHVDISAENVSNFMKNADNFTQRKEEKRKEEESKEENILSEADASARSTIGLILKDKTVFYPSLQNIEQWKELYPGVEVEKQIRKMSGWLEANPNRRKTRGGILRFINGWLSREQDHLKGGDNERKENHDDGTTWI